jgi:radical SAM protein with 4Fe4S-binding SPASM domain
MNQSTQFNIKRKGSFVDEVVYHNDKPLFSFIDINPTELCNRTCEFCPRFDPKIYPNQNLHMDIDIAHKIREELEELNWTGSINICGNGEPLLHKDIVGLVSALGDKIHVEITTNGDFLTIDLIKQLYNSNLDYMVVSMYDGPEQLEFFTKLFDDSGIDNSKYILRDRWYKEDEEYGLILTNRAGTFSWNKRMGMNKQCFYMHYSLQIDWNGDVLFCIQDIYGKTRTFGNVSTDSLLDIWTSNKINNYRKLLGEGKRTKSPCNKCDASGIIHGYNHFLEWKKIND